MSGQNFVYAANDGINGNELWITDGTAEGTRLLKDIAAGVTGSDPAGFAALGDGRTLFQANDGVNGVEIWITDGTTAGTQLLKDIAFGAGNSRPSGFTALGNGKAMFMANSGALGNELWITDGTAAGTQLLKDIYSGSNSSDPSLITALGNGKFLFQADNGVNGREFWITDGTADGTQLLKDINPNSGFTSSGVALLDNGRAVFDAYTPTNGWELWTTDGTSAGTQLVKEVRPGADGSNPRGFTSLGNGKVVFTAYTDANGYELWTTDGTAAGTQLVKDIQAGTSFGYPSNFKALGNGTALFSASDGVNSTELWITDGTAAGTQLLKDINPGVGGSSPYGFASLGNGKTLFQAYDSTNGYELWITDGTSAGTQLVKDIQPGATGSNPLDIRALGDGRAVFQADDGVNGRELWITDGTAAGTQLLKDASDATATSNPYGFTALGNGKTVFTATTGAYHVATGQYEYEVWITDGTSAGTQLLKDIYPGTGNSNPFGYVALGNGKAVFQATDGVSGQELWITDGTNAGTQLLKDINVGANGSALSGLTALGNGKVLFQANDGTKGGELWVTDGTAAGTQLVKDVWAGANSGGAWNITALGNGKALFQADNGVNGTEAWVTDGTSAGTQLLKDIFTGTNNSSYPFSFAALGNGKALFYAYDRTNGYEPWVTDGTGAGTQLLKDIYTGSGSSGPQNITAFGNGKALFSANDGVKGYELWITDGTTAGTQIVKDIVPGANGSGPQNITALGNGKALFSAIDGFNGAELWITDGTAAGTQVLKDIYTGNMSSSLEYFTAIGNGKAVFRATDGTNGAELWITDGTSAGTQLVKDINTGVGSSNPYGFSVLGDGRVMFSADDGIHGTETWVTDGTAAGTQLLKDINIIQTGSAPNGFTPVGIPDNTPPVAPGVALLSDTGSSSTDGQTSNAALKLTGLEDGATLSYVVDGGPASASYDPAALADGLHTVAVTQTDKAGNVSGAGSVTFTLDRIVATPTLALLSDTGSSSTDGQTSNAALKLTGLEDGATLSYVVDGGPASASYDPAALADGLHTVAVTQTDKAGNVSGAGSVIFTLDTVAPDAPSVTLTTGTSVPTASLAGTAAPGGTVVILDGSAEVARVQADAATGAFAFDFGTLGAGTHRLVAASVDEAGNLGRSGSSLVEVGTAAGIAARLDALAADASLAAIYLTDGSTLPFTSVTDMEHARQFDAAALAKIVGSYAFQVTKLVGTSTVVTLYDPTGHLTQRTTTQGNGDYTIQRYDAANNLSSLTYVHDGLREEKQYGIVGKSYQRQEAVYDANDKLVSSVRYYAEGNKMAFSAEVAKDGSQIVKTWTLQGELTVNHLAANGALTQQDRYDASGNHSYGELRYADGSKETHVFDPTTAEELKYVFIGADKSRAETTYHIQGKDYAEQTLTYDAAGTLTDGVRKYESGTLAFTAKNHVDGSSETHNYDTSARETQKLLIASDGSKDAFQFTYAGTGTSPTTATQTHSAAGGVKQWVDVTNADGSHAQTAYAAGVTLTSHEGVADAFRGFKGGADTFVFGRNSGRDTVTGFEASGTSHDTLAIDDSYAADFASLQGKMTAVGADTLIKLDDANSILLKNVAPGAITAEDVRFVHHDPMLM